MGERSESVGCRVSLDFGPGCRRPTHEEAGPVGSGLSPDVRSGHTEVSPTSVTQVWSPVTENEMIRPGYTWTRPVY